MEQQESVGLVAVQSLLDGWAEHLRGLSTPEPRAVQSLIEESLRDADDLTEHRRLRRRLKTLVAANTEVADHLRALIRHVESLRAEWIAFHRYTDAQLRKLEAELEEVAQGQPTRAAHMWLAEILDALRVQEWDAVLRIASWDLSLPRDLREGAATIRSALGEWRDGAAEKGLELLAAIATAALPGWADTLDPQLRGRAHRVAAWIAVRRLGDAVRAADHLDTAVALQPYASRSHAERAALFLFLGDVDSASAAAQRAIELDSNEPSGYLNLGMAAELSGEFEEADDLYVRGLARMSTHGITRLYTRASIADPTGRLLTEASAALLERGRVHDALAGTEAAALVGVRGDKPYADARLQHLRSVVLERLPDRPNAESAEAGVEAAKRHLWNGDPGPAIAELERALELDDAHYEAGWLLADGLAAASSQVGAPLPVPETVARAREVWQTWSTRFGPPTGASSWAWLTRAVIADLESCRPDADRATGLWHAIVDVERALVHDGNDAQRWALAARYQRAAGLVELGFEALNKAYALDPSGLNVLSERLVQLGDRGCLDEAEAVAREIEAMFGTDAWLSGMQAWLAFHRERYDEAIELLDMPLSEQHDVAWYLNVRALCHLALDDRSAALEDYRILCELGSRVAVGGDVMCLLAKAYAVQGRIEDAEHWLGRARAAALRDKAELFEAAGFVALAADQIAEGEELLARALTHTTTRRGLDDTITNTRLRLRALDDGSAAARARDDALSRIAERIVPERRATLDESSTDPAAELAELLRVADDGGPEIISTAALAIRARRLLHSGDAQAAARDYDRLRTLAFEPEATVALISTLARASEYASRNGHVAVVRDLQDRLVELGALEPVDGAIAVAAALERGGSRHAARQHLREHAATAAEDPRAYELWQRLGELALSDGDVESADQEFETAFSLARGADEWRIAQLDTRLAVTALLKRDREPALAHMSSALDRWKKAGSLEPIWTLLAEIRGVVLASGASDVILRAADALHAVFDRLRTTPELQVLPKSLLDDLEQQFLEDLPAAAASSASHGNGNPAGA
jgi:tetratricopeptide (TPR) repeat protein